MTINMYRREPGRPMIYNLESASKFLKQTKQPMEVRLTREKFLIIQHPIVKVVSRTFAGEIGIDLELDWYEENSGAENLIYKYRKYINARFTA